MYKFPKLQFLNYYCHNSSSAFISSIIFWLQCNAVDRKMEIWIDIASLAYA